MSTKQKKYDSTVAQIAGNIAGVVLTMKAPIEITGQPDAAVQYVASYSVRLARAIVAEVERTEPKDGQ